MTQMISLPSVYPKNFSFPEKREYSAARGLARLAATEQNPQLQIQHLANSMNALIRGIELSDQRNFDQLNRIEHDMAQKKFWLA